MKIQIKYSAHRAAPNCKLTMPRPTKKSTRAKAQRCNGNQHFTTAEQSDSASEYATSAEHFSISNVSSSEAEEPVLLPGPKPPPKSRKRKLKSAYMDAYRFVY